MACMCASLHDPIVFVGYVHSDASTHSSCGVHSVVAGSNWHDSVQHGSVELQVHVKVSMIKHSSYTCNYYLGSGYMCWHRNICPHCTTFHSRILHQSQLCHYHKMLHCLNLWCAKNLQGRNLHGKYSPVKQSASVTSTDLMLSILHEENSWLLASAPSVAWGNMMKFPCVPPGEQTPEGSCWTYVQGGRVVTIANHWLVEQTAYVLVSQSYGQTRVPRWPQRQTWAVSVHNWAR